MSRKRDEQLGENGEASFYDLLRKTYPHATQQTDKYHRFDFCDRDSRTDFELKTRRCAVTAYPELFMSMGKIRAGRSRVTHGISRATVYVWSFETPGWEGREVWAWRDDGRKLKTTRNGNRSRGSADSELALIPRGLLLPWNMWVEQYGPTSLSSCETITEMPLELRERVHAWGVGLPPTRTGSYCPSHFELPKAPNQTAALQCDPPSPRT